MIPVTAHTVELCPLASQFSEHARRERAMPSSGLIFFNFWGSVQPRGGSLPDLVEEEAQALCRRRPPQHLHNAQEGAILPFCMGRCKWLFADTVAGANASEYLYSLLQTSQVDGVAGYHDLRSLFIA